MQTSQVLFLCLLALAGAATTSPLSKVIDLLAGLESQIVKEGEEAAKINSEKEAWCKDTATNLGFEIKTGESEVDDLNAKIGKEAAAISSLTEKIEQLGGTIAKNDMDLKAATKIREEEATTFSEEEAELNETVSALQRAISILEREMAKGGSALVQVQHANSVMQALEVMVKASVFSKADASRLSAFVQSQQESEDADAGAPAAAAYESKSGSIVDVLEDLLDKASSQLSDARKKESSAMQNFKMLKQSLEDEIKFSSKNKDEAQKSLAKSEEEKAAAEGALSAASADLSGDKADLEEVTKDCASYAEDYAAATKSRTEELQAVRMAIKALKENAGGAADVSYGLAQVPTLLQTHSVRNHLTTSADLANFEAVKFVRDLARKEHSAALAQLANHMASAVRFSQASGEDPFEKVKGLITDMIAKLESEAGQDATHKAYCDEEMSEASTKQEEKSNLIEKLSTKIGQMQARSAQLKDSVATLQRELALIAKTQAEMNAMRKSENSLFVEQQKELTEGISGVQVAIKTLKDYYAQDKAHDSNDGAASSIVGLLEVCLSDFTKTLADIQAAEATSQSDYEATTKANEIETTSKSQDVKYQNKEIADLEKAVAEATNDRATTQSELDAVEEYLARLKDMCVAKPETYEQRAERRASEIEGLKQALKILEGGAALLQRRSLRARLIH
jgi:predicted  nucleic acid-binding Zn-ribbon protein